LPYVTLNARQNSLRSNAGFINHSLTMDATWWENENWNIVCKHSLSLIFLEDLRPSYTSIYKISFIHANSFSYSYHCWLPNASKTEILYYILQLPHRPWFFQYCTNITTCVFSCLQFENTHGCCILQFFEHFASKQTLHLEWLYLEEWFYQFWSNMLLALSSSPVVYLEAVACERVSNILHIYYCFLHLFAVLEYIGHRNWERHNVNLKYLTTLMIIRWDYFYNYMVLGT
jgi:hypothetical protein